MKILITGATGYAGRRLLETLAGMPVAVRAMVHHTPLPRQAGHVDVVTATLDDRSALRNACAGMTHVVHLAGPDAQACQASPVDALGTVTGGTLNVAEAAADAGVERFVYASTVHVYGRAAAGGGTLHEELAPQPTTAYGLSRVAGEAAVRMVAARGGMDAVVLRLANGFGAPAELSMPAWQLVINDLCWSAVHRGELVLKMSGAQRRDFIPLSDTVGALTHFLSADRVPPSPAGAGPRVFNIGSGSTRTLLDAAHDVQREYAQMFGRRVPLRTGVDTVAEPPMTPMDTSRARAAGFVPALDIAGEIRRTLAAAAAASTRHNETQRGVAR